MYINADNIEEYIEQAHDPKLLVTIVQAISARFPNEKPRYFDNGKTFSGVAFGKNPQPTNGYEEAGSVNISVQKNYIALYFYSFFNETRTLSSYTKSLPQSSVGKGCLKIKNIAFLEKHEQTWNQIIQDLDIN